jgi:hypothetical protein
MDEATPRWWARGLLFENCNCQAVCPGHVHFDQLCTRERCLGYWALRFDEGEFGGVALAGMRAVVAYDSPQHMIEGAWTQSTLIDAAATSDQRRALEAILSGRAGGPWAVLARFVARRLAPRFLPIRIEDGPTVKRIAVDGLLDSTVQAIRGRDRSQNVTFQNMFNQIHAPTQTLAKGVSRYDDGVIAFDNDRTHGLWSRFDWSV